MFAAKSAGNPVESFHTDKIAENSVGKLFLVKARNPRKIWKEL